MTKNTVLTLSKGRTSIDVWTLGGRINAATWNGVSNLLNGSTSAEEARTDKLNHGSIAGPVANRIANAEAQIDGQTYHFEKSENRRTLLHAGSKSTRDAIWQVAKQTKDSVTLELELAHLQDDFPGNRKITAVYDATEDGFDLTFKAVTDATTLMNLAFHPYWALGTDRAALRLQVPSETYLPVDNHTIPTGDIQSVADSLFDLRALGAPSDQIDHNYCFPADGQMRPVAVLTSDHVQLNIESDAPGLQVFTGKSFGFALEPQHWPDAPHHDAFPSIELRPGETYSQVSRYRFSAPD